MSNINIFNSNLAVISRNKVISYTEFRSVFLTLDVNTFDGSPKSNLNERKNAQLIYLIFPPNTHENHIQWNRQRQIKQ